MENEACDKLIFAILKNDYYEDVVEELNKSGFYVTVLRSSGGFLKKPMATLMIGVNHTKLEDVLELLRGHGDRVVTEWAPTSASSGMGHTGFCIPSVPVPVRRGGVVFFVVDVSQFEKH